MTAPFAIELKDLRKSFGNTEIIRGANLAVTQGERIGIIGPNGAGKSTLFNLISGRFGPTSGEIVLVIGIALVYGVKQVVGRAWGNLTVELQQKGAV